MSIVCKDSSNQTIEQLYQWDINYEIYITGVNLSSTPLCHFCNRRSKVAYVVAPTADNDKLKVTIPNALLTQPDPIFLYLYYNTVGGTGRTVYVVGFPVVPRQCPQNYTAVDNYLSVEMIDQAILEYIVEAASQISDGLVDRVTALETSTDNIANELADAHIGYDDTEYQSTGDAIRAVGAAVAAIDPVPNVHPFASQADYNNNIDPIYSGDFIVITTGSSGEKKLMFKQKDGTVTTLIATDGFYRLPPTGIPLTDLSDEVQAMIQAGGSGDITINSGHKTFGFVTEAAYEAFIEDYPDALQEGDYIWINESTPVSKKYTLYVYDPSLPFSNYKSLVFNINNSLYINVSTENDEFVVDTTIAQIRQALTQNRDLVLITEAGVPIDLSDISYTGGVASEVQFTTTAFGGEYHILSTYIIDGNGLTVRRQNISLAGIKDIVVDATNDNDTWTFEIAALPDYYNLSDLADDGGDLNLNIQYNVGWVPFRHPLIAINRNAEELIFGGIETAQRTSPFSSDYDPVLAIYTMSYDDPEIGDTVTRIEFDIDNANVPGGGGTGGTKTTWCGTCSTATSTAAKTVSLSGYTLETGSIVNITFTNAVNANATLNINSTGAKSIYYHGAAINSGIIGAGATALMFYDGTHYCLIGTDYTSSGGGGGLEPYVAQFDDDGLAITPQAIFSDIYDAYQAGKLVVPFLNNMQGSVAEINSSYGDFYFVDLTTMPWPRIIYVTMDSSNYISSAINDVGDAFNPTLNTYAAASVSVQAFDNAIYEFTNAAPTSITISNVANDANAVIKFNSGATPPTFSIPNYVHMPEDWNGPQANRHYEISISKLYAVVASWPITS